MMKRLIYPLSHDLLYTLLLWLLIGGPRCFLIQFLLSSWRYTAFFVFSFFVGAYFLSLFISLCEKYLVHLRLICWLIVSLFTSVNTLLIAKYHSILSNHFFEIFLGTNLSEVREFFSSQITAFDMLIVCLVMTSSTLGFWVYKKRPINLSGWKLSFPIIFIFLSISATIHNPAIIQDIFMDFGFSIDEVVDLKQHINKAEVVEIDSIHPHNIIVIIGESFAKRHSSLYGYEKQTNPRLSRYVESGDLVLFDSAQSPHISTTEAFRYILTDYASLSSSDGQRKWYDCNKVPDLFMQAGYHTAWFSNQAEKGLWDNLPACYSKICNESLFSAQLSNSNGLDEMLLSMNPHFNVSSEQKNLLFYHLMGQHSDYDARYPADFNFFKASDYPSLSVGQAAVLAAYDNATLYNDSIVDAIISLYQDQETVIFYFPDHGLDLYVSDPNFEGHARPDLASYSEGIQIPFMVYVSPDYQSRFPGIMSKLHRYANYPFNTNRFIHLITDVSGYSYH